VITIVIGERARKVSIYLNRPRFRKKLQVPQINPKQETQTHLPAIPRQRKILVQTARKNPDDPQVFDHG
jgi:hypothetical protein